MKPLDQLSPAYYHYTDIIAERGEGCYVYGTDGQSYLDFTCGIGVTNTGHCHPKVVQAVREQATKFLHAQINIVVHTPILELIEELRPLVPPRLDGFFFTNSGAEAVEASLKFARVATGRPNVIVFQGSFHGRTVGTMSLTTSKTIYRAGYQPLMPGVFVAPFPYAFRYKWTEQETVKWCLEELRFLLQTQTAPSETAAILIEPVIGEGGYVPMPQGFFKGLREICDEHGILLIADEIQSGFGRTGRWFAFEHYQAKPDVIIVAKGIASGLPLSGIIAPRAMMDDWMPGSHGGTYGGNVVSCAAALATVRAMRDEGMIENSAVRGEQLMQGLLKLQTKYPRLGDVRGLGLMIGVEFVDEEGKPDKASATDVMHICKDLGLLLIKCGPYDNTIRFIPPLIVTEEQIDEGLKLFEKAVEQIAGASW